MFEIRLEDTGEVILIGRFDASQVRNADKVFSQIRGSATVNLSELDYISSAGLGVLLATQKRLQATGDALRLLNANGHIRDIFKYSGFDQIFEIE